jgi:hypothetical protein
VWLWKTLTGTAAINPNYNPALGTVTAGQVGSGPSAQQVQTGYSEGVSDNSLPWYTTYIPSTSTYDEW